MVHALLPETILATIDMVSESRINGFMTDPIATLKAQKAKILADAQQAADALDADTRELERLKALADKYGLTLVEKGASEPDSRPHDAQPLVDPEGPAYKAAINVSENAIRAAKLPLELGILYDACIGAGVPLAGKRPQSTLSAYLAHEKSTVESIRRGLYWLKGVRRPLGY
jgi:hypothetical protein